MYIICLDVCRYRKKSGGLVDTLGKMVRRQDYDSYTELEMHAELVRMMLLELQTNLREDYTK